MFAWRVDTILSEFERSLPKVFKAVILQCLSEGRRVNVKIPSQYGRHDTGARTGWDGHHERRLEPFPQFVE